MSKRNVNRTQDSGHQQTAQSDRNKPKMLEPDAMSFDKQKTMDSSWYEEKYPNHKFMWILDTGGEVQKWLRFGASIQADETESQFEGELHGYEAKNSKGYVSVIGGTDHGVPVEQILMKMPKERYEQVIIEPQNKRNEEVRRAMKIGHASESDRNGSNLDTYAANTVTGAQGFEQIAGKNGFNKLVNR